MALLKNDNGNITYPYDFQQLQADHPSTIFTLPLTKDSLEDFPVFLVEDVNPPQFDPLTQKVEEQEPELIDGVYRQKWLILTLSVEEQNNRYNSRANWQQFYNGLLINAAFVRARAGAAEVLAINAAYTDTANALALAAQGFVNVPAVQACFDNLLAVMTGDFELTQGQKDGLQALLEVCYLDRLITFNW